VSVAKKPDPSAPLSADQRIVVLVGKEPFLQGEFTVQVRDLLTKAHGQIDVFRFDGASASAGEVLDECRTFGLMQQHKMVVVDNADAMLKGADDEGARGRRKGPRELFEDYAEAPCDAATLVLRAEKWNRGKLDGLIENVGVIKHLEAPTAAQAVSWAIKRSQKRHNANLERDAAELLVERMGPDLGRLDTELAKLALLAAGPDAKADQAATITRALVTEVVGLSREEEVWVLQTALLNPSRAAALSRLHEVLDVSGHHPTLVTWACVDLARKLHGAARGLRAGENPWALTKTLKLWGAAQDAVFSAARKADPDRLAGLLKSAVEADWKQKTGQSDPQRALETLALRFSEVLGPPHSQSLPR
jgi:DNA polymerase III subunit delta